MEGLRGGGAYRHRSESKMKAGRGEGDRLTAQYFHLILQIVQIVLE